MRNLVRAAVVLAILVVTYWGWALAGAAQLAAAASHGDAEAVLQRVDLPALRRSLAGQIARAFLEQNPQFQRMLPLERQFVGSVGSGAVDAVLREALTVENIAALLGKGQIELLKRPGQNAPAVLRMPPLVEAFRPGPLQAMMSSHFDGPLSFVVDLGSAEGRYQVHLRLSRTTWRLSGVDFPKDVSALLAREFVERVGGLTERHGG